jgi:hypothetical protein
LKGKEMNQKIRELALQAKLGSAEFDNGLRYYVSTEESFEKFAELILRECIDICEDMWAQSGGLPGDGALAMDCANWIRKDFGINYGVDYV